MAAVLVKLEQDFLPADTIPRDAKNNISDPIFQYYGPSIGSCYVPLLKPDERVLVTFHPQQIVINSIFQDTKTPLHNIASFHMSNKIIAFNTVKPAGLKTHWLLILTELNEFHVLALKYLDEYELDLIVIKTFKLYDRLTKGLKIVDYDLKKRIVNTEKCFIKVDQLNRFIMIHSSKNYVIVFELNPSKKELFYLASINRPPREVKRNPNLANVKEFRIFEDPQCYRLESGLVINMELTIDNLDCWLAVVSRNHNLDYSLSYYKMPIHDQLEYYQSFSSLKDCPNLVIPMDKFFIIIYDTYHTICHYPEFDVDFRFNSQLFENNTFETNDYEYYIKQNLNINNGRNKLFKSYTFIDGRKILITTANSEYYIIELDYEFIPYDPPKRKLRSYDLPGDSDLQNILIFRKWEIKSMCSENERFGSGLQSDQIFYLKSIPYLHSMEFLSVNKHSEVATLELKFHEKIESKILSESKLNLPITKLSILKNDNSNINNNLKSLLTFTSGDLQRGHFKTPNFELNLKNETMKSFIIFPNFYVVLNEAISFDITNESNSKIIQRIDVYRNNGEYTASYDFDDNITVTCLTKYSNPRVFSADSDDILIDTDYSMENSFLIITSSGNESDYKNDSDFINRMRTEIMLFSIEPNTGDLILKTMSVIGCKLTVIEIINFTKFRIWGSPFYLDFALKLHDSKSSSQLKITQVGEKQNIEEIDDISIILKLKNDYNIIIDPYYGVFVSHNKQNFEVEVKELFYWSMITAADVYSEDMIVFGDVFGNIFLLNLDYTQSDFPQAKVFSAFNLSYGSIGAICCYSPKAKNDGSGLYDICTVGTSQGAILTISIADSLKNKVVLEEMKYQNRAVFLKGMNFEQVARNIKIKQFDLENCNQLEAYKESEKLLEERYLKVSMITDSDDEFPDFEDIPLIYHQDH